MEKPFYKAILLVLASHNTELYKDFRKIYQQYWESNNDVKVIFVYGNTEGLEYTDHDLVYQDIPENYYPGMISKTARALKHIEETYDYDFLVRTNISTFWVLDRLVKRLENTPKEKCFEGSIRFCSIKGGGTSPNYISGINLILSRDMVKLIISNSDEMCSWSTLSEDWALSQVLINNGFTPKHTIPAPVQHMDFFKEVDEEEFIKHIDDADSKQRDHFRIKNSSDRNKRHSIDISVAKKLLYRYYGKTIS